MTVRIITFSDLKPGNVFKLNIEGVSFTVDTVEHADVSTITCDGKFGSGPIIFKGELQDKCYLIVKDAPATNY